VLTTVELDHQPPFDAAEINNETADRVLPAKFQAKSVTAQQFPQLPLRTSLVAPQTASACQCLSVYQPDRRALHQTPSPGERTKSLAVLSRNQAGEVRH
jgi:hypothetical protein